MACRAHCTNYSILKNLNPILGPINIHCKQQNFHSILHSENGIQFKNRTRRCRKCDCIEEKTLNTVLWGNKLLFAPSTLPLEYLVSCNITSKCMPRVHSFRSSKQRAAAYLLICYAELEKAKRKTSEELHSCLHFEEMHEDRVSYTNTTQSKYLNLYLTGRGEGEAKVFFPACATTFSHTRSRDDIV